ncbi:hypothetical protein FHT44_004911 [Mycolicibacterium sp. BK634]|nr:hypothetical protein [Mycolicibacterium sp. BK634]
MNVAAAAAILVVIGVVLYYRHADRRVDAIVKEGLRRMGKL